MKKFLALLLALVMSLSLVACGGGDDTAADGGADAEDGGNAETAAYQVAMITDYGDITDQSFNQTTYEACKAYCEANGVDFNYYKPSGDSTAERVAMIEKAVEEGYTVIVMPGYAFGGAIKEAQDTYPDVKFVALDVSEYDITSEFYKKDASGNATDELLSADKQPHVSKNVYSAVYKEELCGYMAGYAAVKMGYKSLGFLGGMAVPAVQRYGYGFVQGVDAAAAAKGVEGVEVNYIYGGQFNGDGDITAVMDTWYSNGTQLVFACGGGIFTSAAEAAQKVNGKVIGVDTDQSAVIDGGYGEGMTVTSAMKGLAPTTIDTLTDVIVNGNWANYAGKIETLGLVSADDPSANYVQLPLETTQWADGKFTVEDYTALVADMFNGKVKVSNDTTVEPTVSNIAVNYLGNIKG